jgi:hypothetical protein
MAGNLKAADVLPREINYMKAFLTIRVPRPVS